MEVAVQLVLDETVNDFVPPVDGKFKEEGDMDMILDGITVNVTMLDVTLPPEFDTVQRNLRPLS